MDVKPTAAAVVQQKNAKLFPSDFFEDNSEALRHWKNQAKKQYC